MDCGNPDDPDTTYNFDTNASPPDPVTPRWSSLYAAEQYGSCPQAAKQLSYDWAGMKTLVDGERAAADERHPIDVCDVYQRSSVFRPSVSRMMTV